MTLILLKILFYTSVNHNTSILGAWKPINARATMWYHVPFAMLLQLPKKVIYVYIYYNARANACAYQY